jgi:predicted regulator of Ras-like GTPase activity (Roadblock/LC7/MglB family)/ribosomal protein L40E
MIICSNCGTTNSSEERICRTCGALLPISNKSPRIKIGTDKKKTKSKKKAVQEKKKAKKPSPLELQEIPKEFDEPNLNGNESSEYKEITQESAENENIIAGEEKEILKEITPKPFRGSIISSKVIFGTPSAKATKKISKQTSEEQESTLLKQKQLEEDMTKVLKFLSKKITVEKLPTEKTKEKKKEKEKVISPSSMNEILKDLLKLDLHIEASAIVKKDGTILASAISSRISDSLFATIGQSLSLIGMDVIESLSAGKLLNISLRGTNGVLDLAPIDIKTTQGSDMILIILSHPRVKSGIIHFAANIVKKQVKEYLGFSK